MIRFIGTSVTGSHNRTRYYNAVAILPTFQSTVAHALGFSVYTSLLATDFNIETSTSNHYEIFVYRLQSLCAPVLICTQLILAIY
jgi:hypothetical protein